MASRRRAPTRGGLLLRRGEAAWTVGEGPKKESGRRACVRQRVQLLHMPPSRRQSDPQESSDLLVGRTLTDQQQN